MAAFVVWTVVACIFAIMGVIHWKSNEIKGVIHDKVPEIPKNNIKPYNHAVGKMFWIFSVLFELLGLPLLLWEQNDPRYIITIFGTILPVIVLCLIYSQIEKHYKNHD